MDTGFSKDITAVVAIYNGEKYLPHTLDSFLDQTLDHAKIEVILVDDASVDDSLSICEEYAKRNSMFKVISHEVGSGGPMRGWNEGIECAQGELVVFQGQEDYFMPEAFERIVKHYREWNSDVITPKVVLRDVAAGVFASYHSGFRKKGYVIPDADIYASSPVNEMWEPWHFCKVSFLRRESLRFPENSIFTDHVFALKCMLSAKKVSVAADYDYFIWYRDEAGTLKQAVEASGSKHRLKKLDSYVNSIREMIEVLEIRADFSRISYAMVPRVSKWALLKTFERFAQAQDEQEGEYWFSELKAALSKVLDDSLLGGLQTKASFEFYARAFVASNSLSEYIETVNNALRFHHVRKCMMEPRYRIGGAKWESCNLDFDGELQIICADANEVEAYIELRSENEDSPITLEEYFSSFDSMMSDHLRKGSAFFPLELTEVEQLALFSDCSYRRYVWAVSIEVSSLLRDEKLNRYDLTMHFKVGLRWHTFRFGSSREKGVFDSYIEGSAFFGDMVLIPDESLAKNFCLRVVDSNGARGWRPRLRKRPPLSRLYSQALVDGQYGAVFSLAKCVSEGGFIPLFSARMGKPTYLWRGDREEDGAIIQTEVDQRSFLIPLKRCEIMGFDLMIEGELPFAVDEALQAYFVLENKGDAPIKVPCDLGTNDTGKQIWKAQIDISRIAGVPMTQGDAVRGEEWKFYFRIYKNDHQLMSQILGKANDKATSAAVAAFLKKRKRPLVLARYRFDAKRNTLNELYIRRKYATEKELEAERLRQEELAKKNGAKQRGSNRAVAKCRRLLKCFVGAK